MPSDPTKLNELGTPDYTRVSQGSIPDTSLGNLIKGATDIFETAVKVTDEAIKTGLKDHLFKEVTEVRDNSIKQTAIDTERLLGTSMGDSGVPEDVNTALERASRLTKAKAIKSTSDTHYWAQMDNIARQVRSRHPGYRDYIDNYISSLTGATPANALRRALQQQQQAVSAKAQDPMKTLVDTYREGAKVGGSYPDMDIYLQKGVAPPPEVLNNFKLRVLKDVSNEAQREIRKKEDEAKLTGGRVQTDEALRMFRERSLEDMTSEFGKNIEGIKKVAEMTEPQYRQYAIDNKAEMDKRLAEVPALELKFRQRLEQSFLPYAKHLSHDQKKEVIESRVDAFIGNYTRALKGDYGAAQALTTSIQTRRDQTTSALLQDETLNIASAIRKEYGDNILLWASDTFGLKTAIQKQAVNNSVLKGLSYRTSNGSQTFSSAGEQLKIIDKDPSLSKEEKAIRSKAVVDIQMKHFMESENPKLIESAFASLFNLKDPLIKRVSPGTEDKMYATLTSPSMVKRIKELKDMGKEDIYTGYTNYLLKSFEMINKTNFQDTANIKFRPGTELVFDPKKLEFIPVDSTKVKKLPNNPVSGLLNATGNLVEAALDSQARRAVDRLNSSLSGLKGLGLVDEQKILRLISSSGALEGASKDPSVTDTYSAALNRWFSANVYAIDAPANRAMDKLGDRLGVAGKGFDDNMNKIAKDLQDYMSQPAGEQKKAGDDFVKKKLQELMSYFNPTPEKPYESPSVSTTPTGIGGKGADFLDKEGIQKRVVTLSKKGTIDSPQEYVDSLGKAYTIEDLKVGDVIKRPDGKGFTSSYVLTSGDFSDSVPRSLSRSSRELYNPEAPYNRENETLKEKAIERIMSFSGPAIQNLESLLGTEPSNEDINQAFKYRIAYGSKNDKFFEDLGKLNDEDTKKLKEKYPNFYNKGREEDLKKIITASQILSNKNPILAYGFDLNNVFFDTSSTRKERAYGFFETSTGKIVLGTFEGRDATTTAVHESLHAGLGKLLKSEAEEKKTGWNAEALLGNIKDSLVEYVKKNEDQFDSSELTKAYGYLTDNETSTRIITTLISGADESSKKITYRKEKNAVPNPEETDFFFRSKEGKEAKKWIGILQDLARQELERELPGQGELPLARI